MIQESILFLNTYRDFTEYDVADFTNVILLFFPLPVITGLARKIYFWMELACDHERLTRILGWGVQAGTHRYTWNRTSAINTDTDWNWLMVHCHRWVEEKKGRDDLCRACVFNSACTQPLLCKKKHSGYRERKKQIQKKGGALWVRMVFCSWSFFITNRNLQEGCYIHVTVNDVLIFASVPTHEVPSTIVYTSIFRSP